MLHLTEETQVFDFLLCVKFRPSSFRQFIVSDVNEILSFPCKFLYQNVDYVKLTNIQMYTRKRSSETNFRWLSRWFLRSTTTKDA